MRDRRVCSDGVVFALAGLWLLLMAAAGALARAAGYGDEIWDRAEPRERDWQWPPIPADDERRLS